MTEIVEHMVEVHKCCNVQAMFLRLNSVLKMLQRYENKFYLMTLKGDHT